MKTAKLIVSGNKISLALHRQAPFALAILQVLRAEGEGRGLTVEEIIEQLTDIGVIQPSRNEKNSTSNLLQKLINAGAVTHPPTTGGSHRYIAKASQVHLVI